MKGTVRLQIEEETAEGVTTSRLYVIPRDELREVELGPRASVTWLLVGANRPFHVEFYMNDEACQPMAHLFYLRLVEHEGEDLFLGSDSCKEWRLNGNKLNEWLIDDNDPRELSEYLKEHK